MIKGLLFDLNGTVIDIYTSESDDNIYRTISNLLDYSQVTIAPELLKKEYFDIMRRQKSESGEIFPEFDVVKLFAEIIGKYSLNSAKLPDAEAIAIAFRAAGRYKLTIYDGVVPVLTELAEFYPMAAISDGQKIWALSELKSVGLDRFFSSVTVSSEFGFRKPDPRMFMSALENMQMQANEVIFVGNDMFRDIFGAHEVGMKTVFFRSNQGEQNYSGAEADYIIYNFSQLLEAVEFIEKHY